MQGGGSGQQITELFGSCTPVLVPGLQWRCEIFCPCRAHLQTQSLEVIYYYRWGGSELTLVLSNMARPAHVACGAWVLLSLVLTATAFHVPPATLPPMLRPAARSTCGKCLQGLRPQQFGVGVLAGRTSLSAAASEQTLKAREVNVCVVPLHVCLCEREEGGGVGESKRVSEGARGEGARARARGREGEMARGRTRRERDRGGGRVS